MPLSHHFKAHDVRKYPALPVSNRMPVKASKERNGISAVYEACSTTLLLLLLQAQECRLYG